MEECKEGKVAFLLGKGVEGGKGHYDREGGRIYYVLDREAVAEKG